MMLQPREIARSTAFISGFIKWVFRRVYATGFPVCEGTVQTIVTRKVVRSWSFIRRHNVKRDGRGTSFELTVYDRWMPAHGGAFYLDRRLPREAISCASMLSRSIRARRGPVIRPPTFQCKLLRLEMTFFSWHLATSISTSVRSLRIDGDFEVLANGTRRTWISRRSEVCILCEGRKIAIE